MAWMMCASVWGSQPMPLTGEGGIPVWLTNGPFEIKTVGFGDLSDEEAVNEAGVRPAFGAAEKNAAVSDGRSRWLYYSAGQDGYTDLRAFYGWKTFMTPEKIWYARVVYAYAGLSAEREQAVRLHFGGNTITGIVVNGEVVYASRKEINGVKDQFAATVMLRKGENRLLVKIANTHRNHTVDFFDPLRYEWGFWLRVTGEQGERVSGITADIAADRVRSDFTLTPTIFYKQAGGALQQKYLLEIGSSDVARSRAIFTVRHGKVTHTFNLSDIDFGVNMREIYLPEVDKSVRARGKLAASAFRVEKAVELRPLPKYQLYFMPTTHMDIGYTHPQPIVIERQMQTLDQVVAQCHADVQFKWTIETLWLLDHYRRTRTQAAFGELIALIRSGRIAVSPLYSNPYTGWVSEAEMAASFRLAAAYKAQYGIEYFGAVYNDVPGQSWALPHYLRQAGVRVLVDGINELFADYKFQKSLPKVFRWAGASADTVLLYLTEAYVEGARYGLERDVETTAYRLWHRISNLRQRDYPLDVVLVSGAFSDNSGIALNQYHNALSWNQHYAWPRFVIATLNDFCRLVDQENRGLFKTVRGDWTSDWDILYQGESKRMLKYRWVQNHLPAAEMLAALSGALHPATAASAAEFDAIYENLLHFSGHGSGLEYGLGSREENIWTDAIREAYVHTAWLKTRALLEQMAYRITAPKESFESHGIVVFNTLSWTRSMPVEIAFPETDHTHYEVIDPVTREKIPAHRSGDKLSFLARNVPGVGSKQVELVNVPSAAAARQSSDAFIENQFYRVSADQNGWSILERASGASLFDGQSALPALMPLRKRFQLHEPFAVFASALSAPRFEKNDAFEEMTCDYRDDLFQGLTIRLWRDLDRVDITLRLTLEGLAETRHTEEYGLAFPFQAPSGKVWMETLGGLTAPEDRFSAVGHNFFALRRVAGIETASSSYLLASPDCRIFAVDTLQKSPVLIANVVNHFPVDWNRNEDNSGSLELRFFLAKRERAEADMAGFGWEAASEAIARRSWFTRSDAERHYLVSSNPQVKIISLRPADAGRGGFELLLQNSAKSRSHQVTLESRLLFAHARVAEINLLGEIVREIPLQGDSFTTELAANAIQKVLIWRSPGD